MSRVTGSLPSTPLSPMAALQLPLSPLTLTGVPLQPGSPATQLPPLSPEVSKEIEREADQLFRSHTVEQIKGLERDKRLEIDRRREDLRQMVGERYRDLIDAADSIMHMKKCSEQAKQSVATMEGLCQKLQQTHFLRGSGGLRGPTPKIDDHAIAAQVKLLADAPENIWAYLEQHSYLSASLTYLLARHIFSQLTVKLGTKKSFVLVQRLWHSVATFKDTIIQCSNSHLQCLELKQEAMLQCLCAVVLLEGSSPRQLLAQMLIARKSSLQSVFSSSAQHVSVKSQVCQLAQTIVDSLSQISFVFCAQQNQGGQVGSSLLVQRLTQLSNKECIKGVIPGALVSRLPESITGFTPSIASTSLSEIPVKDIHSSTGEWVTMCVSDVSSGMEAILQHITSFKALASIRESVHRLLSRKPSSLGQDSPPDDLSLAEAREDWARICQTVLGHKLCVWDTFLRSGLLQRAKALVDKHLVKGGSNAIKLLEMLLGSPVSTGGDFWTEDTSSQSLGDFKPLSLKAKACSPNIFSFCQSFDKGFKDLITDISHFLGENDTLEPSIDTYWTHQMTRKVTDYPFSLWEDSDPLKTHVQAAAGDCIERFLKNIGIKVTEIGGQMKDQNQNSNLVNRLIPLGNLCHCLMDCSPNFSFLASGCKHSIRSFTKSQKKLRKEENRQQHLATELLHEKSLFIFKIWSVWCSNEIVSQLGEQLSAEMELNSLASSLAWDEIKISEESESGETVSSVIKVPSQSSVYVTTLLFALCQEISRVGGHALDRSLLEKLSGTVFLGIMECYESLLQSSSNQKVPQPCALQLLYNLKFFSSVLVHPPVEGGAEKVETRLKKVVESLHLFVDPFDLDVFMPYILANLERQLTRSSVLYGLLLAVKGTPISSSFYKKPTLSGSQEQHIVIPLAPSISRLPSLPMTVPIKTTGHAIQDVITDSNISLLQTITFFHHL